MCFTLCVCTACLVEKHNIFGLMSSGINQHFSGAFNSRTNAPIQILNAPSHSYLHLVKSKVCSEFGIRTGSSVDSGKHVEDDIRSVFFCFFAGHTVERVMIMLTAGAKSFITRDKWIQQYTKCTTMFYVLCTNLYYIVCRVHV